MRFVGRIRLRSGSNNLYLSIPRPVVDAQHLKAAILVDCDIQPIEKKEGETNGTAGP